MTMDLVFKDFWEKTFLFYQNVLRKHLPFYLTPRLSPANEIEFSLAGPGCPQYFICVDG